MDEITIARAKRNALQLIRTVSEMVAASAIRLHQETGCDLGRAVELVQTDAMRRMAADHPEAFQRYLNAYRLLDTLGALDEVDQDDE